MIAKIIAGINIEIKADIIVKIKETITGSIAGNTAKH